ncbi:uncharacterized protein LOC120325050 [Pipra filicauda]|uniref:Uncharacterized protein LOC120325050 n=1 Tax=Pipra filicauda TaxID=649802 RepID=A0A7R5L638_9PASS|nr:uncharacterized protein LOC120325050 [Pipra filicauda]
MGTGRDSGHVGKARSAGPAPKGTKAAEASQHYRLPRGRARRPALTARRRRKRRCPVALRAEAADAGARLGVARGEGANRRRAVALRADWPKRGRVWILPFVAKLHNGKSIGAGRAAAAPRDPPGNPRPGPADPAANRPPRGRNCGAARRGLRVAAGSSPPPPALPREPPVVRPLDPRARGCRWEAPGRGRGSGLAAPPVFLAWRLWRQVPAPHGKGSRIWKNRLWGQRWRGGQSWDCWENVLGMCWERVLLLHPLGRSGKHTNMVRQDHHVSPGCCLPPISSCLHFPGSWLTVILDRGCVEIYTRIDFGRVLLDRELCHHSAPASRGGWLDE